MSFDLYVAGKYQLKNDIHARIRSLERLGHHITHDWTTLGAKDDLSYCASKDFEAVKKAEIIVACMEKKLLYAGTWFELGVALALQKEVVIIGNSMSDHVFYHHPQIIHMDSWSEFLAWILDRSKREIVYLANRYLCSDAFVDFKKSQKWLYYNLLGGRNKIDRPDEGQPWFGYDPPFNLINIKSDVFKDREIWAVDLKSQGYDSLTNTIKLSVLIGDSPGSTFHIEFSYSEDIGAWIEKDPKLALGVIQFIESLQVANLLAVPMMFWLFAS